MYLQVQLLLHGGRGDFGVLFPSVTWASDNQYGLLSAFRSWVDKTTFYPVRNVAVKGSGGNTVSNSGDHKNAPLAGNSW